MTIQEYNEFLEETKPLVEGKKQNEEPFFYTVEDEKILDKVWDKAAKGTKSEVEQLQAA